MKLFNHTNFAAEAFEQYDLDGKIFIAICAHVQFESTKGSPPAFTAVREQPAFLWEDEYADLKMQALLRQSDFIVFKPGTDVTVLGHGYSPSGSPEKSWLVGLKVRDKEKILRVHGQRCWIRKSPGASAIQATADFLLSEPEITDHTPLRWDYAFGGKFWTQDNYELAPEKIVDLFNPIGVGWIDSKRPINTSVQAPRIEFIDEPITDWRKIYTPAGFSPIAPSWRWRQKHAGTYDENWKETRHPLLPRDFDYRFWQCAPPDQVFSPFLKPGEVIQIVNMHPIHKRIIFNVPDAIFRVVVRDVLGKMDVYDLVLDGIHFDLRDKDRPLVDITWRVNFPLVNVIKRIDLVQGCTTKFIWPSEVLNDLENLERDTLINISIKDNTEKWRSDHDINHDSCSKTDKKYL